MLGVKAFCFPRIRSHTFSQFKKQKWEKKWGKKWEKKGKGKKGKRQVKPKKVPVLPFILPSLTSSLTHPPLLLPTPKSSQKTSACKARSSWLLLSVSVVSYHHKPMLQSYALWTSLEQCPYSQIWPTPTLLPISASL